MVTACTVGLDAPAGPRDDRSQNGTPGSADGGGDAPGPAIDPATFEGPIVSAPSASTRFVRLSHQQWENTVRDLLRLDAPPGLSRSFVAEPLRGTFETNGSILTVSQDLSHDYRTAAEKLATMVARDPTMLAKLAPDDGSDIQTRGRTFIESFGRRAFRRPLSQAEAGVALDLFVRAPLLIGSGDDFTDGIELLLSYFLQSPHFLYRTELSDELSEQGDVRLSSYEVATRLSYALSNTMPDDELFSAAARDELTTANGVRAQATRLLGMPAARTMVADFHAQLLSMREFETIAHSFYEGAVGDLTNEALTFVDNVIFEQGLGFEELLTAPYTFANARVAGLYGASLDHAGQDSFVRLELDPGERAGMFTQVGFLATHAEGVTPNIIMRGVHVARRLLCASLPPPPVMVPPLPEIAPDSTNRERVEVLTKDAPCSGCHTNIINPLGFAFEMHDGLGRIRTEENGQLIDATGSYQIDGKPASFNGAVELSRLIAESRDGHECYARHWVEYLYGRDPIGTGNAAERYLIEQAGAISRNLASVERLLVELVATDAFMTRAKAL